MTSERPSAALPDDPYGLAGQVLPRWAVPAVVVVAVALSGLLVVATPAHGPAQALVMAALLYLVVMTGASFAREGRRRAVDRLATTLIVASFLLALAPLIAIIAKVVVEGAGVVNGTFLTHSLRNIGPTDTGGGIYHGIVGTLEQAAITTVMAVPVAILTAVYLVEYGRGWLAKGITFFVDVMTGVPSIVAGLFVYTVWVLILGFQRSGFAVTFALAILMIPVVVRSTEEMLKLVPNELREASLALGVPRWRTIVKVVIPTALPGIVTGVMLGVARVMGETAPLLLLTGFTSSINTDLLHGPQASLPLIIFDQAQRPSAISVERAWGTALTLIVIVMLLNLVGRVVARFSRVR
ncbi:MAG: phosphate ABC transporter permease PstA [Actinomycetales bacterium]